MKIRELLHLSKSKSKPKSKRRTKAYPEIRRIKGHSIGQYRFIISKGDHIPDKNNPGDYAVKL